MNANTKDVKADSECESVYISIMNANSKDVKTGSESERDSESDSERESDDELPTKIETPNELLVYLCKFWRLGYDKPVVERITTWKQKSNTAYVTCLFNIGYDAIRSKEMEKYVKLSRDNRYSFKVLTGAWTVYHVEVGYSNLVLMIHDKADLSVPTIIERNLNFEGLEDSCSGDLFDKSNPPTFDPTLFKDSESGFKGDIVSLHTGGDTGFSLYTRNTLGGSDIVILR